MAKRSSDPLGLGKLQRRMEGRDRRPPPRYVLVPAEPERSRFSGYRGTLLLLGVVVLVMLVLMTLGGR